MKRDPTIQLEGYELIDSQTGLSWYFNRDTEDIDFQFDDCIGG